MNSIEEVTVNKRELSADTLIQRFDILLRLPNSMKALRETILEMASLGKLTTQPIDEGTGDELLKTIVDHFSRLRKNKVIRSKPIPAGEAVGMPALPQNWTWARLGNIVDYAYSEKKESRDIEPSAWLLDLEDIEKESSRLIRKKTFGSNPSLSTKSTFQAGDVLYCKLRPYLNKVLVADEAGYCTTEIIPIRTFDKVDPGFLALTLRRQSFVSYATQKSYGMNLPRLSTADARNALIPLPPFAEQKRIVAKVDELMRLCDRLESEQAERQTRHAALSRAALARFADEPTVENLRFLFHESFDIGVRDLRETIRSLAIRGKLVPQNDGDEAAIVTLQRASDRRRTLLAGKKVKQKSRGATVKLPSTNELPDSWCVESLANIVDPERSISYGVLVPGPDVPDGVAFVRAQDLYVSGHPEYPNKRISAEIEEQYARTRLIGGEILLCVVGSIGKIGIVPDSWAGANIARAVSRILPIPEVLRDYLLLVLQEASVQNYFTSTTRTLAQPTLNVGMLEKTPIPIPPLAEQNRIVAKVNHLMALVDDLEQQLTESQSKAEQLMEAVVAELVRQN